MRAHNTVLYAEGQQGWRHCISTENPRSERPGAGEEHWRLNVETCPEYKMYDSQCDSDLRVHPLVLAAQSVAGLFVAKR